MTLLPIICICEVCEEDSPIDSMHFVRFADMDENPPFAICEGCYESRPEDGIEDAIDMD